MPEITQPEWMEFCSRCSGVSAGRTADDGCYWACNNCGLHVTSEEELRNTHSDSGEDIPFEEPEEGGTLPQPAAWTSNLILPVGFAWHSRTATDTAVIAINIRNNEYIQSMSALTEWLEANELHADVYEMNDGWIGETYVRRPNRITIAPQEVPILRTGYEFEGPIECLLCDDTHPAYTIQCPTTNRDLRCPVCQMGSNFRELVLAGETLVCTQCFTPCEDEECETRALPGCRYCGEHAQHATCGFCGIAMEARANEEEVPWGPGGGHDTLCEDCLGQLCENCGRVDPTRERTFASETGQYVCRNCYTAVQYGGNEEIFDEEATPNARKLRIPTIPGRENVRDCGVEIEGANGTGNASTLASALYETGLSTYDEVMGYHYGAGCGFAHVEHDSSVDWEVVLGPFNPAVQSDITKLNTAVKTIRGMVHNDVLGLDLRAGLHIHVGAERVSLDGAYNLNTLFSYLEDVIFRLGAARWPVHRAVMNTHYTQPIPKELRKLEFARNHGEEGSRYYALSFNNYFRAMLRHCECGAVRYDSWEDCTCDLGKCTFEFRVFNTTANPRKLHAYLALTQALVSKALSLGKIVDPSVHFPVHSFEPKRFKDMDEVTQEEFRGAWSERLGWMFAELPLTDDEKESLIYCIRHSELDVIGESNISELFPTEEVAEEVTA